jgi:hypothetical protein
MSQEEREWTAGEKKFLSLTDKFSREEWLQEQLEKILVLSHRAMSYWDAHYSANSDDSDFYEELTDITMEIREVSSNLTAMGATHADCILFNEYDAAGNYVHR